MILSAAAAAALMAAQAPAAPAPAAQAPATQPAVAAAAPAPADPARQAAAERMMTTAMPRGTLPNFVRSMSGQMNAILPILSANVEGDPHAAERNRITMEVATSEAARILGELEPDLVSAFSGFYARRMSVADLNVATAFYATPSGRRLATEAMTIAFKPEYAAVFASMDPMSATLPSDLDRRIAEATAHLPPPPRAEGEDPAAETHAVEIDLPAPVEAPAAPATPGTIPGPPAEPARLAAAQRAIAASWPDGALARMMNFDTALGVVMAIRVRELGLPFPLGPGATPDSTLGQLMAGNDPHFVERTRITARVTAEEIGRQATRNEPEMRRVMAEVYARHFTLAELRDIERFYSSPAGRSMAAASLDLFQDPALVRQFVLIMPRAVVQVPVAIQRVTAATAHLPAPPEPEPETEPETEAEPAAGGAGDEASAGD